jgi:rod shape-determining protein MreD
VTSRQNLLVVIVVLTSLLIQVTVLNRLPLPIGRPDLLVVVVIAFALVGGPQRGALIGFATGLAADLIPPTDHLAGRLAFAYTVVGYFAGLLEDIEERSVFTTILVVAVGAAVAVLVYAGLGALVADPHVSVHATAQGLLATVVYDVVLAPFVVPFISAASRRLEPAGLR